MGLGVCAQTFMLTMAVNFVHEVDAALKRCWPPYNIRSRKHADPLGGRGWIFFVDIISTTPAMVFFFELATSPFSTESCMREVVSPGVMLLHNHALG